MYDLPYYKAGHEEAESFIRQYPFATLIGADTQPVATQLPFLFHKSGDKLFLRGHIMKETDHYNCFKKNPEALVIFTGPNTYVSAGWYRNPRQGSTWNYMTVQIRGELKFLPEAELHDLLLETTNFFEPHDSPGRYSEIPESYINAMVKLIEGFSIEVRELDTVFKLSQNKDRETYGKIIEKLNEGDDQARKIASVMREREERVYSKKSFK